MGLLLNSGPKSDRDRSLALLAMEFRHCLLAYLTCCTMLWQSAAGATPRDGPAGDNVIVHLFEWSWKDIERECQNLAKWGYWGVQVINEHNLCLGKP